MKRFWILLLFGIMLAGCSSGPSLQQYYVTKAENPNFLSADLPVSLLNIKKDELSAQQKEAFESLRKMNLLAFKKTPENGAEYEAEKVTVKTILDNDDFTELMKMKTPFGNGTVKYLGDDDAIDEVIIYGDSPEKGFMLMRVLGDNMNPAQLAQFIELLQKSNYDGEGLEALGSFFQ
ncbi:MAG: DUF4252 domain-containing protein [Bacteroidota bacterium]